MAIQQVGGRGVYVITGSGRDPRKTSNGQSWADLVTQQKYMLIQQARQDAQRQIDREFQDYQSRQKATEEYRADVRKQIEEARETVTNIKLKQSEAQTDIDKELLKAEIDRARGRKQTITTGSTTPRKTPSTRAPASKEMSGAKFQQYLTDQIAASQSFAIQTLEDAANDAEKRNLQGLIQARAPEFYTAQQQTIFDALSRSQQSMVKAAQEGQLEVDRLVSLRAKYNAARAKNLTSDMRDIIVNEQALPPQVVTVDSGGDSDAGGTQVTTEQYKDQTDLPDAPSVDYSELITPYEQRIKSLEQQLLQAESPTMPDLNETNRMRQIASQDYGLRTSYRPPQQPVERQPVERQPVEQPVRQPREVDGLYPQGSAYTPSRRAEMDALGVEPPVQEVIDPRIQPQIEPPVQEVIDPRIQPQIEPPVQEVIDPRIQPQIEPPVQEVIDPRIQPQIEPPVQEVIDPRIQPQIEPPVQEVIDPRIQPQREAASQRQETPSPTPAPLPTPTRNIRDIYNTMLQSEEQREPSMASMFDPVKFGTAQEKQQLALKMIMEKAQELGPTNPAYLKIKKAILKQLEKELDPKKARQQRLVEKNQSDNRGDYFALSREVRGLKEQNAKLVLSLFPVNEDTKPEQADVLYKSAKKQIATKITNRLQSKKAEEFLELLYLAYMYER
jgi:hypothetical protein